jgi:hypothetical protein
MDGHQWKAIISSQHDLGYVTSLKPHDNDIPKSNDQLAGYALLLLLTYPSSSLIIAKYARLDETTGQQD